MNRKVALLATLAALVGSGAANAQSRYFIRVKVQPSVSTTPVGGAVVTSGKAGKTYTCGVPAVYGIPTSYPTAGERIGSSATADPASTLCNSVHNANGPVTTSNGRSCMWSTKTGDTYYTTASGSYMFGTDPQGFAGASCG